MAPTRFLLLLPLLWFHSANNQRGCDLGILTLAAWFGAKDVLIYNFAMPNRRYIWYYISPYFVYIERIQFAKNALRRGRAAVSRWIVVLLNFIWFSACCLVRAGGVWARKGICAICVWLMHDWWVVRENVFDVYRRDDIGSAEATMIFGAPQIIGWAGLFRNRSNKMCVLRV